MPVESNSKHVEHFTLEPIGAAPERYRRWQRRIRVVHEDLHRESLARAGVCQQIQDSVTIARARVLRIIDRGDVDQHVKSAVRLEESQQIARLIRGTRQSRVATERTHYKRSCGELLLELANGCFV